MKRDLLDDVLSGAPPAQTERRPTATDYISVAGAYVLYVLVKGALFTGVILALALAYVFVVGGFYGIAEVVRWTGVANWIAANVDRIWASILFAGVVAGWIWWLVRKK